MGLTICVAKGKKLRVSARVRKKRRLRAITSDYDDVSNIDISATDTVLTTKWIFPMTRSFSMPRKQAPLPQKLITRFQVPTTNQRLWPKSGLCKILARHVWKTARHFEFWHVALRRWVSCSFSSIDPLLLPLAKYLQHMCVNMIDEVSSEFFIHFIATLHTIFVYWLHVNCVWGSSRDHNMPSIEKDGVPCTSFQLAAECTRRTRDYWIGWTSWNYG